MKFWWLGSDTKHYFILFHLHFLELIIPTLILTFLPPIYSSCTSLIVDDIKD